MNRYFVRVRTREQLNIVTNWQQTDTILMDFSLLNSDDIAAVNSMTAASGIVSADKADKSKAFINLNRHIYYCLPYVSRQNRLASIEQIIRSCNAGEGIVICNMDELAMLAEMKFEGPVIADSFLYAYNSQTIDFYREYYSDMRFILSDELTDREISEIARVRGRSQADNFIYKIYGHQPLMITAQCISRNYTGCSKKTVPFKDERGNNFCAVSQCSQCYSVIYNGNATSMIDKAQEIGFANILIDFTTESADQIKQVLDLIMQKMSDDEISISDRTECDNNHDGKEKQTGSQEECSRENLSKAARRTDDNRNSGKERRITRGHHYRGVD